MERVHYMMELLVHDGEDATRYCSDVGVLLVIFSGLHLFQFFQKVQIGDSSVLNRRIGEGARLVDLRSHSPATR